MRTFVFLLIALVSFAACPQHNFANYMPIDKTVVLTYEQGRFKDPVIDDYFEYVILPMIKKRGGFSSWEDWIFTIISASGGEYHIEIWYLPETPVPLGDWPDMNHKRTFLVDEFGIPVIVVCDTDCDLVTPVGRRIELDKWYFISLMPDDRDELFSLRYTDGQLELQLIRSTFISQTSEAYKRYQPRERRVPRGLERYFAVPVDAAVEGLGTVSRAYHPF